MCYDRRLDVNSYALGEEFAVDDGDVDIFMLVPICNDSFDTDSVCDQVPYDKLNIHTVPL